MTNKVKGNPTVTDSNDDRAVVDYVSTSEFLTALEVSG